MRSTNSQPSHRKTLSSVNMKPVTVISSLQADQFVLSTNLFFKFNVSLSLVTGELLQNTVDVTSVTYKLYHIKI